MRNWFQSIFTKFTFWTYFFKKSIKTYWKPLVSNPLRLLGQERLLVTISDFVDLKGRHIIAKKNHRSPECIWMVKSPSKLHPKFLFYWAALRSGLRLLLTPKKLKRNLFYNLQFEANFEGWWGIWDDSFAYTSHCTKTRFRVQKLNFEYLDKINHD